MLHHKGSQTWILWHNVSNRRRWQEII